MQENEFEKKLQQKLELLQVQPTAEVWQKVRTQVAQQKKKRRFAFFFLLAFMLGAGALVTTLLMDKAADDTTAKMEKAAALQGEPASNAVTPGKNDGNTGNMGENRQSEETVVTNLPSVAGVRKGTNNSTAGSNSTNTAATTIARRSSAGSTSAVSNPVNRKTKANLQVRTTAPPVDEERDMAEVNTGIKEDHAAAPAGKLVPAEENNNTTVVVVTELKENNSSPVADKVQSQDDINEKKQPEKTVAVVKKEKKSDQDRKWGIAFSLNGGINYAGNSSMEKSMSQDYNSGGVGSGSGNPTSPTAGGNTYMPSPLQRGAAFAAGAHVYRKLGSAVRLMVGLQYNYSSLTLRTGNRVDTTLAQFEMYRSGSSAAYTNRYHYLTVPVSLSVNVFRIGSREVVMDAGASVSRLMGTNALSYNGSQGRYYTGSNELNRTLLSLSAAAAINLAGSGKPAFYLGPQVSYTVTPLAPAGLHQGQRTAFIGIRLQKNLWK